MPFLRNTSHLVTETGKDLPKSELVRNVSAEEVEEEASRAAAGSLWKGMHPLQVMGGDQSLMGMAPEGKVRERGWGKQV